MTLYELETIIYLAYPPNYGTRLLTQYRKDVADELINKQLVKKNKDFFQLTPKGKRLVECILEYANMRLENIDTEKDNTGDSLD